MVARPEVEQRRCPRCGWHYSDLGLTAAEWKVLSLIAQGLSNPAIAETLMIADKSVEGHISNIYSKLAENSDGRISPRVIAVLKYQEAIGIGHNGHHEQDPQ